MKPTATINALLLFVSLTTVSAFAMDQPTITMEPLVGYERVQKVAPTPHSTSRLFYGMRATAGIPLIAAEAELTQAHDTEDFPLEGQSITDKDLKLKLGIRSSYQMASLLSVYARGGGQATKNTHEVTSGGSTSVTENPIVYKPYAGGGITAGLGGKFHLDGGITVVFTDFPHMDKNEYQTSLSFAVNLP